MEVAAGIIIFIIPICIIIPILFMFYFGWRKKVKSPQIKSNLKTCEVCGVELHGKDGSQACFNCMDTYFNGETEQTTAAVQASAFGVKAIIKAYRINLIGVIATFIVALLPAKLSLLGVLAALYCVWIATRIIQANKLVSAVYFILALIPVVNILALVSLNIRVRSLLKTSGIMVDIFGIRAV